MTPQERQLVDDLFDRLAQLETSPRDAEAESAIADGLRRAPNAVYALVQTALVQDEALKRADARIRELTGTDEPATQGGGFLESMRNALTGRTSVPSVHAAPASEPDPRWNTGGAYAAPNATPAAAPFQGGGSFLGTAAASAAGMIGGALLLNSISSMFGRHGGSAFAATSPAASPWDSSAATSDLAREAGLNDIGGAGASSNDPTASGFFDTSNADDAGDPDSDFGDDVGGDPGGDFGDGDSA